MRKKASVICRSSPSPVATMSDPQFADASSSRLWRAGSQTLATGPTPWLMGIVNITPDSFSDGGRFMDPAVAVDQALRLVEEGAQIIDVGGESTRPGADPVAAAEELRRVLPVIEQL